LIDSHGNARHGNVPRVFFVATRAPGKTLDKTAGQVLTIGESLNAGRSFKAMKRITAILFFLTALLPSFVGAASPWVTLEGCTLTENAYNDGDSFHVRQGDREYIFRLYFVDTPEGDDGFGERVREQAEYFGVTVPTVVKIGEEAKAFVRQQLSQPFSVTTRWQGAQGRSKLPRFYALITANGQDLGGLLVSQGLARVFGVRATLPDGTLAETVRVGLLALEDSARHERLGAWTTARQLNVAEARSEALRSETKVVMAPHTISTFTTEMPRRRVGEIQRDTHVHLLEEYSDGWVRIAYDVSGTDQEAVCLRWDLGLAEFPSAAPSQRAEHTGPRPSTH
jgi:endonuclease YncB( thermonuclease family)